MGKGGSSGADVRTFWCKKNFGFFEIYGVPERTRRRGLSQCGHFVDKERGGSIFRDFMRMSFMYGPLSNRWSLQYGVLQQCVELVMISGIATISKWGCGLAMSGGRTSSCQRPLGVLLLEARRSGNGPQHWAIFAIF